MPAIIVLDEQITFITDPVNPCAGEEFTVSWNERNLGDEDSGEYEDIFDLDNDGTGDSKTLQCEALVAGMSSTRSLNFSLPSGNYRMSLVINGQGPFNLGNVIVVECG